MPPIAIIHLIIILESALRPSEIIVYLGNVGLTVTTKRILLVSGVEQIGIERCQPSRKEHLHPSSNLLFAASA